MTGPSQRTIVVLLSVCLLASLCLNLFAGGAWFAGRWLDRRLEASVGRIMSSYPPALRQEVVRHIREDRGALVAAARDLRTARQSLFAAMRAEPFNRDVLASAMADVRAKTGAIQALLQGVLADALETLPASERENISPPGIGLGLPDGAGP